jgi:hypothetical protein
MFAVFCALADNAKAEVIHNIAIIRTNILNKACPLEKCILMSSLLILHIFKD